MNWDDVNALIAKYQAKSGLKGKIIAKCIECSVDPVGSGNWRQQITACNCPTCPLYDVRPVSKPRNVVECDVEEGNMNDLLLIDEAK